MKGRTMETPLRLMIVDDEPAILAGLCELFPWQNWGYKIVACCENGKKALELIPSCQPDVVLTDIRMPEMDGLAFARILHNEHAQIIIAFLSAYADFEYGRQGLQYGVRDFITKPIHLKEIEGTMQRLHQLAVAHAASLSANSPHPCSYEDRMKRAGKLICSVGLRLCDVARELGYDNAKNFSRAFRSYYGIPPSEYRKRKG